jgi:hypothetical protein
MKDCDTTKFYTQIGDGEVVRQNERQWQQGMR